MIKSIKYFLIVALSLVSASSFSQEDSTSTKKKGKWKDKFEFGGYIKYMNTNQFFNVGTAYSFTTDNLIHNRLNFKFYPNNNWTIQLEMRNRIFYGESIKAAPDLYADAIDFDPGYLDMSWNVFETDYMLMNSTLDRANVEFNKGKWNVKFGRQRINWGINLAWNPNDLFNAYNFVDFDYQERPGSDALRVRYYPGALSSIDVACRPGENMDEAIIAGRYLFNVKGYDIQFLGGNYFSDIALGAGWAGNIWKLGFKGEATYFHPKRDFADTSGVVVSSLSFDYSFEQGIYLNVAAFYNSAGATGANFTTALSSFNTLTAKNLLPTEWAAFVQVAGAFSPIFGGGMSVMYLPDISGVFLIPTLSHSIKENWDIDAVGQVLFAKFPTKFSNVSNSIFLRLRWSF